MLIAVGDLALAKVLATVGASGEVYGFSTDKCLELDRDCNPSITILDARLGRSPARAVDLIPRLGRRVLFLTYEPRYEEIVEALQIGAFRTVDLCDRRWRTELDLAIFA